MMLTEWMLLYMPFIVNNLNHQFDMLQQNEWLFRFIFFFFGLSYLKENFKIADISN